MFLGRENGQTELKREAGTGGISVGKPLFPMHVFAAVKAETC